MICYIMCILLWIAYLWLDCMVVAYAFEPRRDSVRQAGIILGLMAAQLPAAALKFLFNDNVLVRYGTMIAVGIVTVAYAAVFLKGTIGQKVLFMLCEYLTAMLAEMLSIGILNKYMEQKPQLSYYTPTMVLLLSVVLSVTAIFFLVFLVVWKKIVEKESFDVSIIIVFSVFPVSQLLMITAINEQVFRNMTLYTGWILAAAEMTEREEAFLSVKAAVKGDYLHICVENSRAKKLLGRPGRKGYGLEILHDLVERNHGQIDVQPGEGSFRVDITVENF